MSDDRENVLRQTPLYEIHRSLDARLVNFGGWEMPIYYSGISEEHLAVRTSAGLFDVSHMGQIEIAGADALNVLQAVTCNNAAALNVGQAQYSVLTTKIGTCVDDVLVYRLAEEHFLLVVNAGNIEKDYAWIKNSVDESHDVAVVNTSNRYALLALQGPMASEILQPFVGTELSDLSYYYFVTGEVDGERATISRTGYSGEDGFEIFVSPRAASKIWKTLLAGGASEGVLPIGLGARDTLRLEAAYRLYGNDINETTTVLEAGLGWTICWDKGDFIGRESLETQKRDGLSRKLIGFKLNDRGIARRGYSVNSHGQLIGTVTSGTQTPFLKSSIGMAYVEIENSRVDSEIEIDVRGRSLKANVVKLPFYRRPGK
tara:strand:- start:6348 stop:7466 length:1119 start_codon:yes stop_codon:yes gene_type:complete